MWFPPLKWIVLKISYLLLSLSYRWRKWHCIFHLTMYRYLPPEIANLRKLQELDLSFNKLKNLPNCIIELSALKFLKVTNNKLVDVPSGISSLRCLESLDLSNNRLTSLGSVKLVSMLTLQYLNLQVYYLFAKPLFMKCYVFNIFYNHSVPISAPSYILVFLLN